MQECLDFPDFKAFLDAYLTWTVRRHDARVKAAIGQMEPVFTAMGWTQEWAQMTRY